MAKNKGKQITKIETKVSGASQADMELKAVVWAYADRDVQILKEFPVEEDDMEFDLGMTGEELPEKAHITIVPRSMENKSHIRRLSRAGHAPTASFKRELVLSREGRLTMEDVSLGNLEKLLPIWSLTREVCGQVVKIDPDTGEKCPVPGATVHIYDVDYHLFWWHPFEGYPWAWLYPLFPQREEIATVVTDECGRFCVEIPLFDIDWVLRWRLRYRCLWEVLTPPTILDALELGLKPDLRRYEKLHRIPELEPRIPPGPRPRPDPPPIDANLLSRLKGVKAAMNRLDEDSGRSGAITPSDVTEAISPSDIAGAFTPSNLEFIFDDPKFEPMRKDLFGQRRLFERVEEVEDDLLHRPAFPDPMPPPALPDEEELLKHLPDKEWLPELKRVQPVLRVLPCWYDWIPEWESFFDVPDIVFEVEQDIDSDGMLETIYSEGYLDVNWNLSQPTTNVEIEAQENAICVPSCDDEYEPCTDTGIVGLNDLPVDPLYLDSDGYALRVNRPNPGGTMPLPAPSSRTDPAQTPFRGNIRLVGCPDYDQAQYYKVFYSHNGGTEVHFNETWYVFDIANTMPHHVTPDGDGFYEVLTPPSNFFPYHTLINWRTGNYPNGRYTLRLALYDGSKNPISAAIDDVVVRVDNSKPDPVSYVKLDWAVGPSPGPGDFTNLDLDCPIIYRPADTDITLRVKYHVAAQHLRDYSITFRGCDGWVGSYRYWHQSVTDNNRLDTWEVTMDGDYDEGGYTFYLEGRGRAYNGHGGLATSWYMDRNQVQRGNTLHIAVLDS